MSVLVVRHGLSEANNRNNLGNLAFASKDAPLMAKGRIQARSLGERLRTKHFAGIDSIVATSELLRTKETANFAGFVATHPYESLNEVEHGVDLAALREMLDRKVLPIPAIEAAEALLNNPPTEDIWFTHGLVIAGLSQVLGIAQDERFIPKFCEVRELPI